MRSLLQGILFVSLLAVSSSSLEPVSANDEVIELLNDCQGTSTFSGEGTLVATNRQFTDKSTAKSVWSNLTKQMTTDVRMTRTYADNQESKTFAWTQRIKVDGDKLTLTRKTSPDFTERYMGTYNAATKTIRWVMMDAARNMNIVLTHDYSQPGKVLISFNIQVNGQTSIRVSGEDMKE
jgi:hypothetical protein